MTTDAFDLVAEMLRRSQGHEPLFPPTELYSEGWMLRLLMYAASESKGGLPVDLAPDATWYSEARLPSPFRPRFRGDPLGEGFTHADGVVGHFEFRAETRAGLRLLPEASQMVVLEAKMGSALAPGTSKVTWFDQAARNVAAMSWAVHQSKVDVDQIESIGFYVIAPATRLAAESTFDEWTSRTSIIEKIDRRIALYADDPAKAGNLHRFRQGTLAAVLDRAVITTISWEDLLAGVDGDLRGPLESFYKECLRHNNVLS